MGDILKVATNDEQKSQTLRLVTGDKQWLGFHWKELNSQQLWWNWDLFFARLQKSHFWTRVIMFQISFLVA